MSYPALVGNEQLYVNGLDEAGNLAATLEPTTTGAIAALAGPGGPIANNRIIANISGISAIPAANTLTAILDSTVSNVQGTFPYRNDSAWIGLGPGLAGQFLQTLGSGANLQWAYPTIPSISPGYNTQTSANNITLTNPLAAFQGLSFTTTGKSVILPAMNAVNSPKVGDTITFINTGTNTFSIKAQDGSTTIFSSVPVATVGGVPRGQTVIVLIANGTANGTWRVLDAVSGQTASTLDISQFPVATPTRVASLHVTNDFNYTGGTGGSSTFGPFRVDVTARASVTDFVWGATFVLNNQATAGNNNTALFAQANQTAVCPSLVAAVSQININVGTATTSSGGVAHEIDIVADTAYAGSTGGGWYGIDAIAIQRTQAPIIGNKLVASAFARIRPQNVTLNPSGNLPSDTQYAAYVYGFDFYGEFQQGIYRYQSAINGTAAGNIQRDIAAVVQTADATPTALQTIGTTSNTGVILKAMVIGQISTHGNVCNGICEAEVMNVGGTLTIVNSRNLVGTGSGAPTVTWVVSGSNMILQVTGVAAQTWNWATFTDYMWYGA